jgi:hypothetical protein
MRGRREKKLIADSSKLIVEGKDQKIITARGPGT